VIDCLSLSDCTADFKGTIQSSVIIAPALSATLFLDVTRFYMRPVFYLGVHTTSAHERGGVRGHRCSNDAP
jgi:hypothetical protein